jgi:DNA invertase Pin-like site-specific DNA recombinase
MFADLAKKVTQAHLKRAAYLYIRQSTLKQVVENNESTQRQYALRDRALSLGWAVEQIVVIDNDLGQSGAHATDREGFQRLVADVGLGRAGIVMGLEVSRLARNSSDWHRLLEICALSDTLILDEDGIYNPAHFNDRLLLGLKGTMSEAELHVLKARMFGGMLNKAKRGELEIPLPVGLVYDARRRVQLDPDQQVQETIKLFFATYARTGSATATCKEFHKQGISFPRRIKTGDNKGELVWARLQHHLALEVLHNPRYAGAYVYGRRRQRKTATGKTEHCIVPRDEWLVLIPGAHPGYISFEEYETNQTKLRACSQAYGHDRRKSPPREGPALLQGVAICGFCGNRMTIRYNQRRQQLEPEYVCQKDAIENCQSKCQFIPGASIDRAISDVLLDTVSPIALEVALSVQDELQSRAAEVDALRKKQVERARYEAELAKRRYMQVDPENRLVAASLEADWNGKLRELTGAQKEYETQREKDELAMPEERRREILSLSSDFPKLWNDPETPVRERKRLMRLIIEDVTLRKEQEVSVAIRFKGGAVRTLILPRQLCAGSLRKTSDDVVKEIDRLLDHHAHQEIARLLNQNGFKPGEGESFSTSMVSHICQEYNLKGRWERERERGFLSRAEVAALLNVKEYRVTKLVSQGYVRKQTATNSHRELYERPGKREIKLIAEITPSRIGRPPKQFS